MGFGLQAKSNGITANAAKMRISFLKFFIFPCCLCEVSILIHKVA